MEMTALLENPEYKTSGVNAAVREVEVPEGSILVGMDIVGVQLEYNVRIVASRYAGKVLVSPPVEAPIAAPATLAVIAQPDRLRAFVTAGNLTLRPKLLEFRHLLARSIAGIAELVVPPNSHLIGLTAKEMHFRMTYGLSLLSIIRAGKAITDKVAAVPFEPGDMLICHSRWEYLTRLEKDRDFVIVTTDYPREYQEPYKLALALTFFWPRHRHDYFYKRHTASCTHDGRCRHDRVRCANNG